MSIKYGFFNAVRTESGYDRVYSNEDMNDFLKGIISQNGIFTKVGNQCMVDYPDGVSDDAPYNSIVVPHGSEPDGVESDSIMLRVKTGKALVNSHWVVIDSDEEIYLKKPDISGAPTYYMITLRWDSGARKCYVAVTEGNSKINLIPQGFNEATQTFSGDDGICELCLAYVTVPGRSNTSPAFASDIIIEPQIGKAVCPYISHLVVGPDAADVDQALQGYYKRFDDWFKTIEETYDLHQEVKHRKIELPYVVKRINSSDIPEYHYETNDIINIYINGIRLVNDVEWTVEFDGSDTYFVLTNIPEDTMIEGNSLTVSAIKAATLGIEDGDIVKY